MDYLNQFDHLARFDKISGVQISPTNEPQKEEYTSKNILPGFPVH